MSLGVLEMALFQICFEHEHNSDVSSYHLPSTKDERGASCSQDFSAWRKPRAVKQTECPPLPPTRLLFLLVLYTEWMPALSIAKKALLSSEEQLASQGVRVFWDLLSGTGVEGDILGWNWRTGLVQIVSPITGIVSSTREKC